MYPRSPLAAAATALAEAPLLLTKRQAAELLGLHERSVERLLSMGVLRAVRPVAARVRLDRAQGERWVAAGCPRPSVGEGGPPLTPAHGQPQSPGECPPGLSLAPTPHHSHATPRGRPPLTPKVTRRPKVAPALSWVPSRGISAWPRSRKRLPGRKKPGISGEGLHHKK